MKSYDHICLCDACFFHQQGDLFSSSVWVWRTESAASVPVHYLSWSGWRPLPCWEPNVMWCRLTRPDVPPATPPLLLTAGGLVEAGTPPHSLQLPRYHLTLLLRERGENGIKAKHRNTIVCRQASCREDSNLCRFGEDKSWSAENRMLQGVARQHPYKQTKTVRSLIFQLLLNYLKICSI